MLVVFKEKEMGRACRMHEAKGNVYRVLVGKPEGKRLLGRIRGKWDGTIKMELREIRWGVMG
jgi:hypothetical protein